MVPLIGYEARKQYLLLSKETKAEVKARYGFFFVENQEAYSGHYEIPEIAQEEDKRIIAGNILLHLYINFPFQFCSHDQITTNIADILVSHYRVDRVTAQAQVSEMLGMLAQAEYINAQEGVYSISNNLRGYIEDVVMPAGEEMLEARIIEGYDFLYSPTDDDLKKNFERLTKQSRSIGLYNLDSIAQTRSLFEWMYDENRSISLDEIARFLGINEADPMMMDLKVDRYILILRETNLISMSSIDKVRAGESVSYYVSPVTYIALIKRKKLYPRNR